MARGRGGRPTGEILRGIVAHNPDGKTPSTFSEAVIAIAKMKLPDAQREDLVKKLLSSSEFGSAGKPNDDDEVVHITREERELQHLRDRTKRRIGSPALIVIDEEMESMIHLSAVSDGELKTHILSVMSARDPVGLKVSNALRKLKAKKMQRAMGIR